MGGVTGKAAFVRVSILEPVIAELQSHEHVLKALLSRYRLKQLLLRDPYGTIPIATYLQFFEDAARLLDDSAFGARTGAAFRPASLGPVGMLVTAMPTLRRGLEEMSQYLEATQIGTSNMVLEDGKLAYWCYRIDDTGLKHRQQDSEYTLTATMRLIQSSFGMRWRPLEVHVEHKDRRNEKFLSRFFEAPIRFGLGVNRLVMPVEELDRVLRHEDRDLTTLLRYHLRELLPSKSSDFTLAGQTRQILRASLGQKPVTIQDIAASFNMSARSLQRKLADEHTSLSRLLEEVRKELAAVFLSDKTMSKQQIAHNLGYADAAVLWRAMRKWQQQGNTEP